jgi:hypothetical protein
VLGAREYKVFTEAELRAAANGFALSSTGDEIYVFSANANGELTGYMHGFSFDASANGVSFGREGTSVGREYFVPRVAPTPNLPNSAVKLGPLFVTEVMFQPTPVGAFDNTRDEFLEIRNSSAQTVTLFDVAHTTNTWRLRGGADFDFPPNVSLGANGILLIVNFDPNMEPWAEAQFRSRFGVPAGVPIFGPLQGKLSNGGERISLQRPDAPQPLEPQTIPYIAVDEFTYDPLTAGSPFAGAIGTGRSVHRFNNSWGQEPNSWYAETPNPGVYQDTNPDADGDGLPRDWEIANGLNDSSATGNNGANGDPDGDGLTNLQEYQIGTHPNDASSALRLSAIANGGEATLTMTAAENRSYSILYSTNLTTSSWVKLSDIPAGSSRPVQISDGSPQSPARFYRLVSPAQP